MNVRSIMSHHVVCAPSDSTLRGLWKLLFAKHVNAIPVIDKQKKLVGIITKEDLLKILYPDYQEFLIDLTGVADFEALENKVRDIGSKKAHEIMSKRVVFVREETPVMRALSRMIVRRLNQLPVVDRANRVCGMVTKGDIFYALFRKSVKKLKK